MQTHPGTLMSFRHRSHGHGRSPQNGVLGSVGRQAELKILYKVYQD